jgi:hypothetical protein
MVSLGAIVIIYWRRTSKVDGDGAAWRYSGSTKMMRLRLNNTDFDFLNEFAFFSVNLLRKKLNVIGQGILRFAIF